MSLKEKIELIFKKKYHWYAVKFVYKTETNYPLFDYMQQIGLRDQRTIFNERELKKVEKPLHKHTDKTVKSRLQNGHFTAEVIAYLGYFPHKKQVVKNERKQKVRNNQRSVWRQIQAILPK
jgi:hypothetical protein